MPISVVDTSTSESTKNKLGTGSRSTRLLGLATLVGLAVLLLLAFVITDPDLRVDPETNLIVGQGDIVRLLYVHFPVAATTYLALSITAVGSVMVLWKKSDWWDNTAAASAEVGVLFCALTLATGSIWGRPTWNTWWQWGDVRIMTTTILFLIFVGYLAYRRTMPDSQTRAKRSAIVGIVGGLNIPIVYKSVDWWQTRTLHQQSTLRDRSIEDYSLFAMLFGMFVFIGIYVWLVIHRFRIGWLERQAETAGLEHAIAERRAQAPDAIASAVANGGTSNPGTD